MRSDFDIGRPGTTNAVTKRGVYSIGIGRKYYERVYSPSNTIVNDPNIPGPGTYDQKAKTVGNNNGTKYKFQGRAKNPREPANMMIKMDVPGPGHYGQGIEISKEGKYPLSTIPNSKCATWNPRKEQRFKADLSTVRNNPGPGAHDPDDCKSG